MSLFAPPIRLEFTASEAAVVDKPVDDRSGGAQNLLRDVIKPALAYAPDGSAVAYLEDDDLQKCRHYCYYDGNGGGYQGRFRVVVAVARRAGWVEP